MNISQTSPVSRKTAVIVDDQRVATPRAWALQHAEAHFAAFFCDLLGQTSGRSARDERWCEAAQALCRAEEYADHRRFNDTCWEPCFSQAPQQYHGPRLEALSGLQAGQIQWPHGKRFAVCLTHDVDHLQASQLHERWRALRWGAGETWSDRRRLLASAVRHAMRRLGGPGRYPLDIWLRLEERYGFRSTFFVMGAPPSKPHSRDGLYVLDDLVSYQGQLRQLKEILPDLVAGGWEVGLHGSIATAFNADLARQERLRLCEAARVEVISGRQHWLTYDIQVTPRVHEAAGILVDSTLGSNLLPICYRAGTGLPFPMYDLEEDRVLNVVQVPLIIQDGPLMQNNSLEQAVADAVACLQEAAARGSLVTLLFHNDHHPDSPVFRVYEQVLAAARDLGAWGCTAGEIYKWLKSRCLLNQDTGRGN